MLITEEKKLITMGRIIKEIKIKPDIGSKIEKKAFAVFDTGSERSYVKKSLMPSGSSCSKIPPFTSKLGGNTRQIKEQCILIGVIEDLEFGFSAFPVDDIGIIDGQDVGILIGATAMEEWDIRVSPKGKTLDLEGLKKREFVEL